MRHRATINDLFDATEIAECTDDIINKAVIRKNIGNPPGKSDSYGDEINWECMLSIVPEGSDLYIISADKDYCSEIDSDVINPFLKDEWKQQKKSNVYLYKTLVDFLKEHLKTNQLKAEQQKEELITKLQNSPNFEETHKIINILNCNNDWTNSQVEKICEAAVNNTQISWILGDSDVLDFYYELLFNNPTTDMNNIAVRQVVEKVLELKNND